MQRRGSSVEHVNLVGAEAVLDGDHRLVRRDATAVLAVALLVHQLTRGRINATPLGSMCRLDRLDEVLSAGAETDDDEPTGVVGVG